MRTKAQLVCCREAFIIGSSSDGGKSKAKTRAARDGFAMIERVEDRRRRRNLIIYQAAF